MSPEKIRNIAIYTRVSTEEQAKEGFSLEAQLKRLEAYCLANEWNIVGIYIEEGYSGTNTKRPQYQKMFEDMDKWDGILVIKMDRIHRNRLNFISMMSQLKRQEKEFISMSESLNTGTAMGRFVMGIMQDIAQLESEQTGERTFTGMKQKAQDLKAGWNGGKPPFGYRVVNHKFIPIQEDLDLVKKAFEMYIDGSGINHIAKTLNKPYGTVQIWLHNPIYAGYLRWSNVIKKFDDIEPIISPMLFNQVQRIKAEKTTKGPYEPLLLNGKDVFEIKHSDIKNISAIHKPKHNLEY